MDDSKLIATEDLTFANVPPGDADLEVLQEFCLTIDGYQGERFSIDFLLAEAKRIERRGLGDATLDELRSAAFIRQRELRWTSMDDGHEDSRLVRSIRALVSEIRRRVS